MEGVKYEEYIYSDDDAVNLLYEVLFYSHLNDLHMNSYVDTMDSDIPSNILAAATDNHAMASDFYMGDLSSKETCITRNFNRNMQIFDHF